ncbi:hypothetical protein KFU94_29080 [Chloroflexi bacterium TSY]|nr:hypothetical protein [Chloroflexi bacterium TSY]
MYTSINPNDQRRRHHIQFERLYHRSTANKIWSAIRQRPYKLPKLYDVGNGKSIRAQNRPGIDLVPIAQIRGSEGRCCDFDTEFRPLKAHSKDRWIGIALAYENNVGLPAVDLIRVNDDYYVRDGHHRISVAKVRGQLEIEANVQVWNASPTSESDSPTTDSIEAIHTEAHTLFLRNGKGILFVDAIRA